MKKIIAATAVALAGLSLGACGALPAESAPTTQTSVNVNSPKTSTPAPVVEETTQESEPTTQTSAKVTSVKTSTPVVEETARTPEALAEPAQPAPVAPTFVQCQLADGTALMSDGTTTYMDSCNESAGGPMLLEDGTSIYDHLGSSPGTYTP